MKILKDIFKSEGIENAFDEELRKSLKQIDETDVPSNFTTFYNQCKQTPQRDHTHCFFFYYL